MSEFEYDAQREDAISLHIQRLAELQQLRLFESNLADSRIKGLEAELVLARAAAQVLDVVTQRCKELRLENEQLKQRQCPHCGYKGVG